MVRTAGAPPPSLQARPFPRVSGSFLGAELPRSPLTWETALLSSKHRAATKIRDLGVSRPGWQTLGCQCDVFEVLSYFYKSLQAQAVKTKPDERGENEVGAGGTLKMPQRSSRANFATYSWES